MRSGILQRNTLEVLEYDPRLHVGKVQCHPGSDPELRTEQERLLELLELPPGENEDDFVHDLLLQDSREVVGRAEDRQTDDRVRVLGVGGDEAEEAQPPVWMRLDDLRHLPGARVHADQQQGPIVEPATPQVPSKQAQRELLGHQQQQVEGREKHQEGARHEVQPEKPAGSSEGEGAEADHLDDLPDFLVEGNGPTRCVRLARDEQERPDCEYERQQAEVA